MHEAWLIALVVLVVPLVRGQLKWVRVHGGGLVNSPTFRRDTVLGFDASTNQLVLFGGRPGPLGDTWLYNITTGIWRKINSTTSPPARHSFVGGVSDAFFTIATGQGQGDVYYSDVWRFDLRQEKWEDLPVQRRPLYIRQKDWTRISNNTVRPGDRSGSVGGIYPGTSDFFVSQGFSKTRYFDTFTYNLQELGWYQEFCDNSLCNPYNPSYPHARYLHSGTPIENGQLVIFGGCLTGGGTGGPCPSGDSWLFSRKSRVWTRMDECATPRTYGSMAALKTTLGQRRVVLYGGIEFSNQVIHTTNILADEVAVLNPDTGEWSIKTVAGQGPTRDVPVRRASASMVLGSGGIYMFGGYDLEKKEYLNDLWLLEGDASTVDTSPSMPCTQNFINYMTIHGILMAIGWGFFLQWGAFMARYFDCKSPVWFFVHVMMQVVGLCCAIAGFIMGVLSVQFDHFKFGHAILGLVTMVLGVLQPLNAVVRPKKLNIIDQKSSIRRVWETVHHFGGRSSLLCGLINISLGLFMALSSFMLWLLWFIYVGFLVGMYAFAETLRGVRGRKREDSTKLDVDYYADGNVKYATNDVVIAKEPPVDYGFVNPAHETVHL